jgi:Tfp pilus assembly protein PilE
VVILLTLGSIAIVKYGPVNEKAYSAEAYTALAQIVSAENVYKLEGTTYTTNIDNLNIDDPNDTSKHFTYDVTNTDHTAYATAHPIAGTGPVNSYSMCLQGGLQSATASLSCPDGT